MKVVRILGGLGNQMFQYALFLALKKAFPQEETPGGFGDCGGPGGFGNGEGPLTPY